jgi:DNA-binding NarL/FixJ family response regulator
MDSCKDREPIFDYKGATVPYQVRILLIEGDKAFQNEFNDSVQNSAQGIKFYIENCDGHCIAEKGECDTIGDFDIYVCGNPPCDNCTVLDFIKAVKKRDAEATIFVLSDSGDPGLLKKIVKMNVEGLIDRDTLDLNMLLDEIKTVSETYDKVRGIVAKLNRLSALKSVG